MSAAVGGFAAKQPADPDRYYGQAPMLRDLQEQCTTHASHFLVCVRDKLNVKVQRTCADGSAEVEVTLRERQREQALEVVPKPLPRGRLRTSSGQWTEVRLWTSLDVKEASAAQLLELYAQRWEQKLCYRELKLQINQGTFLAGQRVETAAPAFKDLAQNRCANGEG